MKSQKMAVWIAVGIGAGVAIGAATHSMALWICIGVVAGAAIGAAARRSTERRSRSQVAGPDDRR
jgi:hypothetical protein